MNLNHFTVRGEKSLQPMIRPRGYKTFSMLNSVEHETLNAHKCKKYHKIQRFLDSDKPKILFFMFLNIVCILIFMSRKNSMLN